MIAKEPQETGRDWLARFERERGRRLRVLHIGNIANNAYNNAKIQRQRGIDADVIAWDYFHIMGCPEWEDAEFEGDVGDPFFPDWWAVDLRGYSRPRWFAQGRLVPSQRYLVALRRGKSLIAAILWQRLEAERWLLCRKSPPARFLRPVVRRLRRLTHLTHWRLRIARRKVLLRQATSSARSGDLRSAFAHTLGIFRKARAGEVRSLVAALERAAKSRDDDHETLGSRWAELFPTREPMTPSDYSTYLSGVALWRTLLAEYDVIQAYATAVIVPVLCKSRFTAYEHGTLRETPFQKSWLGRTAALGFREADAVFVTNSDVLPAAERLGIDSERIVCLPHAVDSDRLLAFGKKHAQLAPLAAGPVSFLSPTRQDWCDADPSWTKGNDRAIRALALVRDEGLDCRLMLGEWGRDLDPSKRLVAELGLEPMVEWLPPLRKTMLWRAYLETHAVLDQFVLPAIGGVAFEAMALGRRVVTALDLPTAERFFGERPPVLACSKPEEIAAAMAAVIEDPYDRMGHGERARDWFIRRHSADRIVDLQVDVYQRLVATGRG